MSALEYSGVQWLAPLTLVRSGLPCCCWQGFACTLRTYLMVALPSPSTLRFLQPILSPSILDHLINNDRKLPPEYNLPHTYVEMQVRSRSEPAKAGLRPGPLCERPAASYPAILLHIERGSVCPALPCWSCSRVPLLPQSLQIAAFLFTVCHVVIVVQDWFTDLSLYR